MAARKERKVDVAALRMSPIHGIKPISDHPEWLEIDSIEDDPTNPGRETSESLRYQRREPSIRDSYDIIGHIVYPIVVCQHPDETKRQQGLYMNIDGHGRRDQLRRRNESRIWALVYPPLSLEQRVCFRQTLGAAQEQFDAVSVIKDLDVLAQERGLDLSNAADVQVLIRDLPEKVRRYEEDLLMLARWDLDSANAVALGESYKRGSNVIGLDKIRAMTKIVDAVQKFHPELYKSAGGDRKLTKTLASMYGDMKFSTGTRSQEAIRKVASAIRELPEDDALVTRFFKDELDHTALAPYAKTRGGTKDIVGVCGDLAQLLVLVDPAELSDQERRALTGITSMIGPLVSDAVPA
ncbi:MAG: hypothetical protein IH862_10240 [Chloroflexi bacterium]|nr:hypothetical protein [Chloroflexota bacterium]